jgi:hypothetical protein
VNKHDIGYVAGTSKITPIDDGSGVKTSTSTLSMKYAFCTIVRLHVRPSRMHTIFHEGQMHTFFY